MTDYLKLLLIRHGESLGNLNGCLEGQTSTALSLRGQRQAQQLAAYLRGQLLPSHIYSSSLQRAVETATPLKQITGCVLRIEPALQELHQGIFQGLTWADAQATYPELCVQLSSTLDYLPVPGAETLTAAHQRAANWCQILGQRHGPGDVVWVVTHGGLMQHLIAVILGCDRTWQIPIHNTGLFEFWLRHTDVNADNLSDRFNPECWKIIRFNETPHLENYD